MIAVLVALMIAAHPIHTSVLQLRWDARDRSLTGTLRVFEDDLTAAATRARVDATTYALSHLAVRESGRELPFSSCGATRAGEALLVCVRVALHDARSIRVRNTVLMDLHEDQVNIVRLERQTTTTLLLTRLAPEQSAP